MLFQTVNFFDTVRAYILQMGSHNRCGATV